MFLKKIPSDRDIYSTGFRIGDSAKESFYSNPSNTVFDAKRLIGRTVEELEVKRDLKHLPFTVEEKNGVPMISVLYNDKIREFVCSIRQLLSFWPFILSSQQSPEEISAMILTRMKETAEAYLNHGVTHAVVTVPSRGLPHRYSQFLINKMIFRFQ